MVTSATVDSAFGAELIDADGNRLIDFVGGIGVMNAGHCQQVVIDAIHQQASRLLTRAFTWLPMNPTLPLRKIGGNPAAR